MGRGIAFGLLSFPDLILPPSLGREVWFNFARFLFLSAPTRLVSRLVLRWPSLVCRPIQSLVVSGCGKNCPRDYLAGPASEQATGSDAPYARSRGCLSKADRGVGEGNADVGLGSVPSSVHLHYLSCLVADIHPMTTDNDCWGNAEKQYQGSTRADRQLTWCRLSISIVN